MSFHLIFYKRNAVLRLLLVVLESRATIKITSDSTFISLSVIITFVSIGIDSHVEVAVVDESFPMNFNLVEGQLVMPNECVQRCETKNLSGVSG